MSVVSKFFTDYFTGNNTHSIVNSFNDWRDPAAYVNLVFILCPVLFYGAVNFAFGWCMGRCSKKENRSGNDRYQRLGNDKNKAIQNKN